MKFSVASLGCKTNQYEMDALSQELIHMGLTPSPAGQAADLYILNTCTVTAEAERKARQLFRRYRRDNPDALLVACGCFSQRSDLTGLADLVIGTSLRDRLAGLILEAIEQKVALPVNYAQPWEGRAPYEELGGIALPSETRAFLKIQDGCDNRCAYCAICLARGPARSRTREKILEEARQLAGQGFTEMVLTGTNINAYGSDLGRGGPVTDLAGLLTELDRVEGLERIRLGSLESTTITPDFMDRISRLDHLCPHFHLSLQSGSDRILRAMRRRDTTGQYKEAVDRIRSIFPQAGITTDLIVGFPGETDDDFDRTLEFCEEIRFLRIHVFRFSPRPGTAAASMGGQVPAGLAADRAGRLREKASQLAVNAIRERLGQTRPVLVEQVKRDGRVLGYSPEYIQVIGLQYAQGAEAARPGQIRSMRLDGIGEESALAVIL